MRGLVAASAAVLLAAGAASYALAGSPASGGTAVAIYGCVTSKHALVQVSTGTPLPCPSGAVPVSWQGAPGGSPPPSPSPSPSATSPGPGPSPTITSPGPSSSPPGPSPSPTGTGTPCVTSAPGGTCPQGPQDYTDPGITMSNGYNSYTANNCWADPNCQQTLTS